jgi:hypothetical protein
VIFKITRRLFAARFYFDGIFFLSPTSILRANFAAACRVIFFVAPARRIGVGGRVSLARRKTVREITPCFQFRILQPFVRRSAPGRSRCATPHKVLASDAATPEALSCGLRRAQNSVDSSPRIVSIARGAP